MPSLKPRLTYGNLPAHDASVLPRSARMKRLFDITVTALAAVSWIPAIVLCMLAILIFDGAPVFYISPRRVARHRKLQVIKFRTMRRDAERIANRDTVSQGDVRFLNIPPNSPLYTRVGALIERCSLTELPQLLHVLSGEMSLVGNRPLPENVIVAIKAVHPEAEDRFDTPAGMTGPAQLSGRDRLSDDERLAIEIMYCRVARNSYAMRLDFLILLYTVLVAVGLRRRFTCDEIRRLLARFGPTSEVSP